MSYITVSNALQKNPFSLYNPRSGSHMMPPLNRPVHNCRIANWQYIDVNETLEKGYQNNYINCGYVKAKRHLSIVSSSLVEKFSCNFLGDLYADVRYVMSRKFSAYKVYSESQVKQSKAFSYQTSSSFAFLPSVSSHSTSSEWQVTKMEVSGKNSDVRGMKDRDAGEKDEGLSSNVMDDECLDRNRDCITGQQSPEAQCGGLDRYAYRSWDVNDRITVKGAGEADGSDDLLHSSNAAHRDSQHGSKERHGQFSDSDADHARHSRHCGSDTSKDSDGGDKGWSSEENSYVYTDLTKQSAPDEGLLSHPSHRDKEKNDDYRSHRKRSVRCSRSESSSDGEYSQSYYEEREREVSKKGKVKTAKKRRIKDTDEGTSAKIQPLMDLEIPTCVKKQVDYESFSHIDDTRRYCVHDDHNVDFSSQAPYYDYDYSTDIYGTGYDGQKGYSSNFHRRDAKQKHKADLYYEQMPSYNRRGCDSLDYRNVIDNSRRSKGGHAHVDQGKMRSIKIRSILSVDDEKYRQDRGKKSHREHSLHHHSPTESVSDHDSRRPWREERHGGHREGRKGNGRANKEQDNEQQSGSHIVTEQKDVAFRTKSKSKMLLGKRNPIENSRLIVCPCSEGLAVVITHPQKVYMRGRACIRVVAGEVMVMGHKLIATSGQYHDMYSPSTTSLLALETSEASKMAADTQQSLRKTLVLMGADEKLAKACPSVAAVLLAIPMPSHAIDFICTLNPFTQAFRYKAAPAGDDSQPAVKVSACFVPRDQALASVLRTSDEFDGALDRWTKAIQAGSYFLRPANRNQSLLPTMISTPHAACVDEESVVAVLCGGVNSGKSTLGRFMINSALAVSGKVCYFDCDIGQSEFTPPGTVSLLLLDKPVFGPPFTHPRAAESMCFFGGTNPSEDPSHYIGCIQYVYQAYMSMESQYPLIVNTMGWNQDIGLRLLVDILTMTKPDLVIQLQMDNKVANFPAITPLFPVMQPGWIFNVDPIENEENDDPNRKKHELITAKSLATSTEHKLPAKHLRELCLLSHLMVGLDPPLTILSTPPYLIPWTGLAVHEYFSKAQPSQRLQLDRLNGFVVALCRADLSTASRVAADLPMFFAKLPPCECLGYGVVRSVDDLTGSLVILTCLSLTRLSKVNTVVKGQLTVPDQIFLKQSVLDGSLYTDALQPTSAVTPVRPRRRMPRHK